MKLPINARREADGTHTAVLSIDVMVNNGDTYYGTLRKRMPLVANLLNKRYGFELDEQNIRDMVLKKFPTLRNKKFVIKFN